MRKSLLVLLVCLAISSVAHAAPPLVAGRIVVAGYDYAGYPVGACSNQICTIDAALTTVTPISDTLPGAPGRPIDLAIESPQSILVLTDKTGPLIDDWIPTRIGTVLQVTVATGAVTQLATDFLMWREGSIAAAPGGRIFVTGVDGILEIDRSDGSSAVVAAGEHWGLDIEPARTSLITSRVCEPDPDGLPTWGCEFVRIDLATNATTPLGQYTGDYVKKIDVRPNGDRYLFARSGVDFDGATRLWTPTENLLMMGDESYQASVRGIASDLDGKLLIGSDGHPNPDNIYRLVEIKRFEPAFFPAPLLGQLDTDFGVAAIDVTPAFTKCSDGDDDDGDGLADYPADPGCRHPLFVKENPQCDDGLDNDGDGGTDWDGGGSGAHDLQCTVAHRDRESSGGCGLGAELALVFALGLAVRRR